jgi:hypothetical protein
MLGEPDPASSVSFGISNDVQNGESMGVKFSKSFYTGQFVFECSYHGNRRPDTLLLRIDNGNPVTLKITHVNSINPRLIEFGIPDNVVDQLLNCKNSIDLEFTAQNPPSDYVRKWNISSEKDEMELKRVEAYGGSPRFTGPLGIKNYINHINGAGSQVTSAGAPETNPAQPGTEAPRTEARTVDARTDIEQRRGWVAKLTEAENTNQRKISSEMPYSFFYSTAIEEGAINYQNETIELKVLTNLRANSAWFSSIRGEVQELFSGLNSTGRKNDWGLGNWPQQGVTNTNPFASQKQYDFSIVFEVLNGQNKVIGRQTARLTPAFSFTVNNNQIVSNYEENSFNTIIFSAVKVDDLSENMTVRIASVNSVSAQNAPFEITATAALTQPSAVSQTQSTAASSNPLYSGWRKIAPWAGNQTVLRGIKSNFTLGTEVIDGQNKEVVTFSIEFPRGSGYRGCGFGNSDSSVITQLRTANGIRFKVLGDGKLWHLIFVTPGIIKDNGSYEAPIQTSNNRIVNIDIPYSRLKQPSWAVRARFDKSLITDIQIQRKNEDNNKVESGVFVIKVFDIEIY